jgi:REP element-mobilizing transposase RayT
MLFGSMRGVNVELNDLGQLIRDEWLKTAELRKLVELDEFVVMPNHFHAIVWLVEGGDSLEEAPTLAG